MKLGEFIQTFQFNRNDKYKFSVFEEGFLPLWVYDKTASNKFELIDDEIVKFFDCDIIQWKINCGTMVSIQIKHKTDEIEEWAREMGRQLSKLNKKESEDK